MRLVRIQADGNTAPAGLSELTASNELDLVQLDYERPRTVPAEGPAPVEMPDFAAGFASALRVLQKSLYLEPQLCAATSAGWGYAYSCVERAAAALVEGGCPDVPIAAVRGSNLLPILDYLHAGGVTFDNIETGARWRDLKCPILAADLQLGAAPLLTALADGARIVVAGCYDPASPATAAAVRSFGWSWSDFDRLAAAGAAARAAAWSPWRLTDASATAVPIPVASHPRVELDEEGRITVELDWPVGAADGDILADWLRRPVMGSTTHVHADVQWDASAATVATTGANQLTVTGVAGKRSDAHWRVNVLYQAGYVAEVLIELLSGSASVRRQLAHGFTRHFVDVEDKRLTVAVHELSPATVADDAASWLHLVCRAQAFEPCRKIVDQVEAFAATNPAAVRLPAGRAQVYVDGAVWPAVVPRDAVDIAVDTRPAREWG